MKLEYSAFLIYQKEIQNTQETKSILTSMNEIKKIGTQLVFSSLKVRGCVKFSFGNLIRISIETETIFSYLYTYNSYLCAYKLVYPFKVMFMHAINSMRLRSTF